MSQVYGFIKQCKGEVLVSSELNKGTCITLYLPRYKEKIDDQCCIADAKMPARSEREETILVVDDEAAIRKLCEEILTQSGYRVRLAEDGNKALDILAKEEIQLMLTDVIMPVMNGYQLASQVSEKYPQVKIIIASGYNDETENSQRQSVHYKHLDKPYKSSALLNLNREMMT